MSDSGEEKGRPEPVEGSPSRAEPAAWVCPIPAWLCPPAELLLVPGQRGAAGGGGGVPDGQMGFLLLQVLPLTADGRASTGPRFGLLFCYLGNGTWGSISLSLSLSREGTGFGQWGAKFWWGAGPKPPASPGRKMESPVSPAPVGSGSPSGPSNLFCQGPEELGYWGV